MYVTAIFSQRLSLQIVKLTIVGCTLSSQTDNFHGSNEDAATMEVRARELLRAFLLTPNCTLRCYYDWVVIFTMFASVLIVPIFIAFKP